MMRRRAPVAVIVVLGILGGCHRGPTGPTPTPPVVHAPLPAPSGPRLASMAVFPEASSPLEVIRTEPADGSEGSAVAKDEAQVVVRFSRPVVPLVLPGEEEGLPHPLSFTPAVAGSGVWRDTSTYVWSPEDDLPAGTTFAVHVDDALQDVMGGRLEGGYDFSFLTALPAVITTYPEDNTTDAGATRPISITFNQAMDRASAESAFHLVSSDGGAVPGRLSWVSGDRSLQFEPAEPLRRGVRFVATVAAGAQAATGSAATASDYSWRFQVAPEPALVSSEPADGDVASTTLRDDPLRLTFNTPMNPEAITVTLQPTITNQSIWFQDNDRTAMVYGGWIASTPYVATVKGTTESRWGDPLGADATVRFTTAQQRPRIILQTTGDQTVVGSDAVPVLYVDAMNQPAVHLRLHPVPRADYLKALIGPRRYDFIADYTPTAVLREWDVDTSAPVDTWRRITTTLTASGSLEPGPYIVSAADATTGDEPADTEKSMLSVTDTDLVLKRSAKGVLVWATSLTTAAPAPGVDVVVYDWPDKATKARQVASGTTDGDGILQATFTSQPDPWSPLAAVAEEGDVVTAAVSTDWSDGIESYAFGFGYDPTGQSYYGTVYTDRPIYRTGQTAYYRGTYRGDDDATYSLPLEKRVHMTVRDPNYETILETDVDVSDFGTYHGQIDLSSAAGLGTYQVEAAVGPEDHRTGIGYTSFVVAAYRKPEYEVTVATDKPEVHQGDTITTTVTAAYYFGGPVADAKVTWRLLSDDFFFQPDVKGRWSWIDYDLTEERYNNPQGEVVREGEGTLDADGRLVFALPADISEYPLSQVFTLDVEVTDLNNQAVAGRASVVVHKGAFYVGVQPADYLAEAGDASSFHLLALTPDGDTVPGVDLTLRYFERTWYSVREKREDGAFYWTSSYTDTLESTATATTDRDGTASVEFTAKKPGVHRLVATARDAAGNEISSAAYMWITGRGFVNWRQENNDRIELVADKSEYTPGDTARILVPAPFGDADALLTIERGNVLEARRIHLSGNSETLEVPIRSDFIPNVYVSVFLVKGVGPDSPVPQMKLGYTNLAVSDAEKVLSVRVDPQRSGTFGPRDTVTYTLRATDSTGKPAQAEFSAAVVDKALLALTGDASAPSLESTFYGQRMLGVGTSAAMTELASRHNQELATEKKGGGGSALEEGTTRRLFRDTAYWNPAVVTGPDGTAQVTVSLPDNLTTWQTRVEGLTKDTLVGGATNEIVTTKPVLVRPVLPRFLVVGDTLQLETIVNSSAETPVDLKVTLQAPGLQLAGDAEQRVTVPAGGKVEVDWPVAVTDESLTPSTALESAGEVTVRMAAIGDGFEDSVAIPLPVYRFNAPDVVATAGTVEDRTTEEIRVPEGVDPGKGGLTVEVAPSLAAATIDALDWLADDPLECTVGAASHLAANAATYGTLKTLDVAELRPDVDALGSRLERQLGVELQLLYGWQNGDGGWGWCAPDSSRPWLTAYALYGMDLAADAGFTVSGDVRDRAAAYLADALDAPVDVEAGRDLDERAFFLFVLANHGAHAPGRVVSLYERREALGTEARAFLALALDLVDGDHTSEIAGLMADLGGKAVATASGSYWEEPHIYGWSMGTNGRTTSAVVLAMSRLDPENTQLAGAVRWLMTQRREAHWETDQETAWAVLALGAYMASTGELDAAYHYDVRLNDAALGTGDVTAASVDESARYSTPMSTLRTDEGNQLDLRKQGRGLLYYTAFLRAFRDAASQPPIDKGIVLGREYFKVDPKTFTSTSEVAETAAIGDIVQVRLTLIAPTQLFYVRLEDHLPAGFEAVDTSLATTSVAATGPTFEEAGKNDESLPWWERHWWSYWTKTSIYDDRVALFAPQLDRGTYEYTYLMRASLAGTYQVIPALVEQTYMPESFGRSAGGIMVVTP